MSHNDNIDKNEILFWQVIHNKFLFLQIFNQIHTVKWIKVNDISDYHIGNRMKFKHITSLHWMIKNEQFALLKCKLESGDQVNIDENGIQSLFKKRNFKIQFNNNDEIDESIMGQIQEIGYYRVGDEKNILKRNEIQIANNEKHENNLKETLKLLLKYKRDQLVKMDIISIVLSNIDMDCNIEMIKLIINQESNSLPVTDKALEFAIKYPKLSILKILLNSSTTQISNHIKNNSISWAIGSYRFSNNKLDTIEFILNNQLYNIPTTTTISNTNDDDKDENGIVLIKYSKIFSIRSSDILEKLYKLKYLQDDIDEIDEIGGLGKFNNGENNCFKDVFKHYCLNDRSNLHYYYFMCTYDEMIDGNYLQEVYNYAIKNSNAKALQYILSNLSMNLYFDKMYNNYWELGINGVSNEFIKYYSIGYNHFKYDNTDENIIKYIHSFKSESDYQDAYNSISNESEFKCKLSSKWFDISKLEFNIVKMSPKIKIKDTSTVDLIAENVEYIKNYFTKDNLNDNLHFSNYQLIEYTIKKYPNILIDSGFQNINYPFINAIYNCDIDQLKQLNDPEKLKFMDPIYFITEFPDIEPVTLNGEYKPWSLINDYNIVSFNFKNQSTSNVIKLLEYLNSTGYQKFSQETFVQFIKCICATPSIDLSKLKIDFSVLKSATAQLFIDSIRDNISLKVIQLILNNFNPFKPPQPSYSNQNEQPIFYGLSIFNERAIHSYLYYEGASESLMYSTLFYRLLKEEADDDLTLDNNGEVYQKIYYCTSDDPIDDIQSIIKLLLDRLNKEFENIEIIQDMVNLLFKRLIKVRNVTIEQVDSTYKLISSEWLSITGDSFTFQHSLYHMVHYLGIKSLKLIKFITSHHSVHKYVNNVYTYGNLNINYEHFDNFTSEDENSNNGEDVGCQKKRNSKI